MRLRYYIVNVSIVAGAILLLLQMWWERPPATHHATFIIASSTEKGMVSTLVVVSNKVPVRLTKAMVGDMQKYVMQVTGATNVALLNVMKVED